MIFLTKLQDIVQVKLNQPATTGPTPISKAFQIKIGDNKTLIVYNRVNNYILEAVLKAVFNDAH